MFRLIQPVNIKLLITINFCLNCCLASDSYNHSKRENDHILGTIDVVRCDGVVSDCSLVCGVVTAGDGVVSGCPVKALVCKPLGVVTAGERVVPGCSVVPVVCGPLGVVTAGEGVVPGCGVGVPVFGLGTEICQMFFSLIYY